MTLTFNQHFSSNACNGYIEYKSHLLFDHQVDGIISNVTTSEIQVNRVFISAICDILLLCARQNLPLRGHRESSDTMNRGNFAEILTLLGKYNNILGEKLELNLPS